MATEKAFQELQELAQQTADLSVVLRDIADNSGLTYRQIAECINRSPSTVGRLKKGFAYKANFETLALIAWACGYKLEVTLAKRS